MRYSLLLFDADDTLFDYSKAEKSALAMTFHEFCVDISSDIYLPKYQIINKEIWTDLEKKLITPDELKAERFRRLFESLGIKNIFPNDFSISYLIFLSKQTFLLPNVIETLERLFPRYKMALITNGLQEVQRPRINNSKISRFFDDLIISDEIGIAKPDKRFFDYTLDKLNHKNHKDVLIIGDNLSSDILGGINSGIDTCWINSHNKFPKDIKPTFEINNIIELKNLLI